MPKSKTAARRNVPAKRGRDPQRKIKITLLVISFLMILGASAYHAYKRFGLSVVAEQQMDRSKSRPDNSENFTPVDSNTEETVPESGFLEDDSEDLLYADPDEYQNDENVEEDEVPIE